MVANGHSAPVIDIGAGADEALPADLNPSASGDRPRAMIKPLAPGRTNRQAKSRRPNASSPVVPTLVIDTSAVFRAGLIHLLSDSQFRVIAECCRLDDLPEKALNHAQTVMLLGIDSARLNVREQIARFKAMHGNVRIILLIENFRSEVVFEMIEVGGCSCLEKTKINQELLLKSLELTLLEAVVICGDVAKELNSRGASIGNNSVGCSGESAPEFQGLAPLAHLSKTRLSDREKLILTHLTHGDSNKHIAREIGIAEATVKVHVKSLLRKLQVRNRTQAAMWGMDNVPTLHNAVNINNGFAAPER